VRPGLRRAIAFAGAACLSASAVCLGSDTALRAAPLLAVRLRLPFAAPRLAVEAPAPAEPAPSPMPSLVPPARRRTWLGEGPIVLKGDGTYQLALNRSSRNGIASGADNYATALSMVAERRTEQTSLSISSAFGYGAGSLAAGTLVVGYRTPKYGLSYGQVTGPSDSQLQIGGFARGIGLAVPVRNGDVSYLLSTAQQTDGTTYRVLGMRRAWNALGGYLVAGEYYGAGETGGGHESITDLGYRRYGAKLSTDTEIAVSSHHGVGGVADGAQVAAAFHADLAGKSTSSSLGLRFDPAGFQTLTGNLNGGFSGDLAIRRHSERLGDVDLNLGHTDDKFEGSVTHENRATLSGNKSWSHVALQYVFGLNGNNAGAGSQIQRSAGLTLSETLGKWALSESYQTSAVNASNGSAAQAQIAFGVSRPLLGGSASYQYARSAIAGGDSVGEALAHSIAYRRSIGKKADVQIVQSFQTSSNNGIGSALSDTTLSFVRRLSSVVAVQVSANVFHQTGIGGGGGSGFQASLVGPFGFGQPRQATGRANPNLPAVIRGVVTYSASSTPFAYNAPSVRGYNNVLVILDGRVTQRTDANGEFEFRFVPQGTHTLRIDSATIQPGLIADREYQTIQLQGGQTSTVSFSVGNFAGVTGSVVATDAAGRKRGIGNVGIAIDGIQAVTTTPEGKFSVGRLSAGAHTVEIVESTLPSTVAFVGDKKKTVTVTPGTSTPLTFVATPLGSIAGSVLAPGDGGFGPLIGLKNVYVVAQPGEHAVITDDDGAFILDNMPPGAYTLTVDPDTIPEGLAVLSGPESAVAVEGGNAVTGLLFKLGAGAKQVIYTFSDGRKQAIQVSTEPAVVPPGGLLRVTARTNAKDVKELAVESDVFGGFPLRLDPHGGMWTGSVVVPALAKGDYALSVTAHRKDVSDGSSLVPVDPRIALFTLRLSPRNPEPGHTVRVTLKALAAIEEGDALLFEDGYKVLLPKPSGHVFGFDIRLWRRGLPYSANLVTKRGQTYPLSLR
jgi:hypothetical protein